MTAFVARLAIGRARAVAGPAPRLGIAARSYLWVLLVVAALGVWLLAFGLLFSGLYESHAQHDLYDQFRLELANATTPIGGQIPVGSPVALVTSSAADLDGVTVVEGTSSRVLRAGPGHLPGGPLPGQAGVSVLMGRSASYGAPFAHITDLQHGDVIHVITGQGRFDYVVEDVRRAGDPFPPTLRPGASQLTLVTSEGDGWQSGWSPTHAVYVDALLDGAPVARPDQQGVATAADGVLHSDTSGMYPLILWLQLLLIAAGAGVWAWSRWGRWQTWLVAVPIGLAALWGASSNLWLLLPNLM